MTSIEEADAWIGRTAVDDTGEQVGMISQIWVDDASGQPAWASVTGPTLGKREVLVSLTGTVPLGGGVQLAYTRAEILDAPQVAGGGRLDLEEMEQLCAHYGTPAADAGPPPRAASWMDRMEASITRTPEQAHSPAGADPAAPRKGRRLRRKPARTDQKASRRFGRRSAAADPLPADLLEPASIPTGG